MDKQEVRELWNIINARRESILDELKFLESLMNVIEDRAGFPKSNKIIFPND
jgi:hypothetical protein